MAFKCNYLSNNNLILTEDEWGVAEDGWGIKELNFIADRHAQGSTESDMDA